ncbi:Alpha/Beta hydrolase protein [Plectosphaerella cucumerina]|uniref:Alpha/Beta hydrolase protein n=1 Tax=Plectosphaerella cucumerina TaxID=40658 RepID=A0A8K0TQZ0_9PEZI|nr:Alpha/Beta hydrolase protein [Plectosphaerella cucumerina]
MSIDFHQKAFADEENVPFRAAILSSGQSSISLLALLCPAVQAWKALAKAVGCSNRETQLQCLREAPWQNLMKAMRQSTLKRLWRDGRVIKVPLLVGTTVEEGRGLMIQEVDMTEFLEAYFKSGLVPADVRDTIVSVYEADPRLETDFDIAAAIFTDYLWQCPRGLPAELATPTGSPVWQYQLNASITDLLPAEYAWLGRFHGSEAWLLFSEPEIIMAQGSPRLLTLYETMRGAIGQFARAPGDGPGWPAVGAPEDVAMWGGVVDERREGSTPVNRTLVDARCGLYTQLYRAIESVVG